MLHWIRRSLALKLILVSAVPSAAVLLTGLFFLISAAQRTAQVDVEAAFLLLRRGTVIGAVVSLGFAALAVLFTTRRFLVRPAQRLVKVMGRAEAGEFLVRAQVDREDELGQLSKSFNTMLARITDLTVNEIDNQRAVEQMQRELSLQRELQATNERLNSHVREIELVLEIASSLSGTLDLPEQLEQLGHTVCEKLNVESFSVLLVDAAQNQLVAEAVAGQAPQSAKGVRIAMGEGVAGAAAATGATIYVPDVEQDPRYLHYAGHTKNQGSFLSIPLREHGRVMGTMNLNRPQVDAFSPKEIQLAEAVAVQAALAIANARLHAQTVELSFTDALTGVGNRRALLTRLNDDLVLSLRFGDELSLLMLDLDGFKAVNDKHGHPTGDRVLRGVAQALKRNVRKVDLVARFGGEEFCVVLPRVAAHEAREVAEKLRRAIEQEPFVDDRREPLRVTVSIGAATYGTEAHSAQALLEKADQQLYVAKRAGKNRVA
ncbi:MAG: diguanylate cyclase [Deltaproteobacteria bacterium]|nr:diguanylate cyclase [Deltaproteobacteria bacterium]